LLSKHYEKLPFPPNKSFKLFIGVVKQTGKVLLLEGRKVPGTAFQLKEALGRLPGNQVG
jgi:hypothetical protein